MSEGEVTHSRRTQWSALQKAQLVVLGLAVMFGLALVVRHVTATPASTAAPTPMVPAHAAPAAERPDLPAQNQPEVAERAARDVLQKLKGDPENFELLAQAGNIYLHSRVFVGAAGYYERALRLKDDATVRNNYGNALFYSGEADRALEQYEQVLKADPKNVNALFNRGMVCWRGKHDPQGAVQSWKLLLKASPTDPRRAGIEKMIAQAQRHAAGAQ